MREFTHTKPIILFFFIICPCTLLYADNIKRLAEGSAMAWIAYNTLKPFIQITSNKKDEKGDRTPELEDLNKQEAQWISQLVQKSDIKNVQAIPIKVSNSLDGPAEVHWNIGEKLIIIIHKEIVKQAATDQYTQNLVKVLLLHELGHIKKNHIPVSIIDTLCTPVLCYAAIRYALTKASSKNAPYPLALAQPFVAAAMSKLLAPLLSNALSRICERQADTEIKPYPEVARTAAEFIKTNYGPARHKEKKNALIQRFGQRLGNSIYNFLHKHPQLFELLWDHPLPEHRVAYFEQWAQPTQRETN